MRIHNLENSQYKTLTVIEPIPMKKYAPIIYILLYILND